MYVKSRYFFGSDVTLRHLSHFLIVTTEIKHVS